MYIILRHGRVAEFPDTLGGGIDSVRAGGGVLLKVLLDPSNELGSAIHADSRFPTGKREKWSPSNTSAEHELGF